MAGASDDLAVTDVREVVGAVLSWEDAESTDLSVTFLSAERMRALNRRARRADRTTDVIAYRLPHPGSVVGDVYVCPAVARRSARAAGIEAREELVRLVVHGTLHVLGWEHADDETRVQSEMWLRQERYVQRLVPPNR